MLVLLHFIHLLYREAVVDETESGVTEDVTENVMEDVTEDVTEDVREGLREGMKEDVGEDVGGTRGKEKCLWDKFLLVGAGNRVTNPGEERET